VEIYGGKKEGAGGTGCWEPLMKDKASYDCDSCGEEIVVPIDLSAGTSQEYVEDCPVCCCPNVVHAEIDEDGDVRVWAQRE
jgi:Cysteine-rich CPXCG